MMRDMPAIIVEVDAALIAGSQESQHHGDSMLCRLTIIRDGFLNAEIDCEARPDMLKASLHPCSGQNVFNATIELGANRVKTLIEARRRQFLQAGEGRQDGYQMSHIGTTVLAVTHRSKMLHDLALTGDGAD